MLEEILSLVRSIDKATSPAPPWFGEWAKHAPGQIPCRAVKEFICAECNVSTGG